MIVFLTLIYVAALALLVKLGVIRLTLFWKLSPLLWMLLLFIVLFIPLQWGAPTGPVIVYQPMVEIVPNVSGEVVEVTATGMKMIPRDSLLFKIDPEPFELRVASAKAGLEQAKLDVEQLQEEAAAAELAVESARQDLLVQQAEAKKAQAAILVAQSAIEQAKAKFAQSQQVRDDFDRQVVAAERDLARYKRAGDAVSESEVDRLVVRVTGLQSQAAAAGQDVEVAQQGVSQSQANLEVAQTDLRIANLKITQLETTELPRLKAAAHQARLAADAEIDGVPLLVAQAQSQLDQAEFDLRETEVRAPADGYAIAVSLRPGQRVANLPMRSWMTFVNAEVADIVVGIPQYTMRYVEVGQPAEVTFKSLPGQVFPAVVDRIARVNEKGQLPASGLLAQTPTSGDQESFAVVLRLADESELDSSQLRGGAYGTATIYTEHVTMAHVIRKVMIRMQAWQNYVVPW